MIGFFQDLEYVFDYTNNVLNVGNYILPAISSGLVGEVISITGDCFSVVGAHCNSPLQQKTPFILNIDLDFWAPEMDYIDRKKSISFTRDWMKKADLITIATSPFFIDQQRAIEVLDDLF